MPSHLRVSNFCKTMHYEEVNGEFCQKRSRSCGSAVPSHSHSRLSGTKHDTGNTTILTHVNCWPVMFMNTTKQIQANSDEEASNSYYRRSRSWDSGENFRTHDSPPSYVSTPDDYRTGIEISLSAPQPTLLLSCASSPTFPTSSSTYRVDKYTFRPPVPPSRPHHGEYTRHLA